MLSVSIDLYKEYGIEKPKNARGRVDCLLHNSDPLISQNRKYPAMVVIAGGGYEGLCSRENMPFAERFYVEGFNCFILHYSFELGYPYPVAEGLALLDFLRRNTAKFSLLEKVVVIGASAGGHLAGLLSNCSTEIFKEAQEKFPLTEYYRPDGTVYCYPVVTANPSSTHERSMKNFLKGQPYDAEKFSVENLISAQSKPCFIFHCVGDSVVTKENSLLLAEAYYKHGVEAELHLFAGGEHGTALPSFESWRTTESALVQEIPWLPLCLTWLKKQGLCLTDTF